MINLDMVGRLRGVAHRVRLGDGEGVSRPARLAQLVPPLAAPGVTATGAATVLLRGIPGLTSSPTSTRTITGPPTIGKLDFDGLRRVANFTAALVSAVANREPRWPS
jgi:hypothetical protein